MQDLIVSMMRFSAALTLFGVEQIQKSLNMVEGKENLSKTIEQFEKTVASLTDVLVDRIDEKKKETLKSVTKMSEDLVGKSAEGMKILDPLKVIRATSDLIQKTTEAAADRVSKATAAAQKATESTNSSEQP